MADYAAVQKALTEGADPATMCGLCTWDRICVSPPSLTTAEVQEQVTAARREDQAAAAEARAAGRPAPFPFSAIVATAVLTGRDMASSVCPVFALRLRSSGGRVLTDRIKNIMQEWPDAELPAGLLRLIHLVEGVQQLLQCPRRYLPHLGRGLDRRQRCADEVHLVGDVGGHQLA
jgi:hypothetical protein